MKNFVAIWPAGVSYMLTTVWMKAWRPIVWIVPGSVWGPCLWAVILFGNAASGPHYFDGMLFSARYFDAYVLYPLASTWVGAMIINASLYLLWRRIGSWTITAGTLPVFLSGALIMLAAALFLPGGWLSPSELVAFAPIMVGLIALFSVPAWITLLVATVIQRRREQPKRL